MPDIKGPPPEMPDSRCKHATDEKLSTERLVNRSDLNGISGATCYYGLDNMHGKQTIGFKASL